MEINFTIVDSILKSWLKKYGLTVYTEYKDEAVRLIPVVDNQGTKFEISIESMVDSNEFKISAFSESVKSEAWKKIVNQNELENALDETYKIIELWIENLGHKRNWF
jgi:hypothetical protein